MCAPAPTGPAAHPNAATSSPLPPSGSQSQVMRYLDEYLRRGYEGVVFKSLTSVYRHASRDNDWCKLKPDMIEGMGDTLDLLILGAPRFQRRRALAAR